MQCKLPNERVWHYCIATFYCIILCRVAGHIQCTACKITIGANSSDKLIFTVAIKVSLKLILIIIRVA